jgi:hypothetical protein
MIKTPQVIRNNSQNKEFVTNQCDLIAKIQTYATDSQIINHYWPTKIFILYEEFKEFSFAILLQYFNRYAVIGLRFAVGPACVPWQAGTKYCKKNNPKIPNSS